MKKAWVLSYPLSAQQRLRSDWADAQSDLSLCWAHMLFCRFCHALAQFKTITMKAKWVALSENIPSDMFSEQRFRSASTCTVIKIFTGHILDSQGCKVSSCGQWRLWSDCTDEHTDLGLCWAPLCDREVTGSIPSWVIPKTLKMVLAALLLGAQH